MWLIIRKLRSAQFTTNFYKYGWGGQCNSKFKSWWNLMESLSFRQPMSDVPGKVGTSPVCLSRATCRSQSGFLAKPAQAPQSFSELFADIFCNIRVLVKLHLLSSWPSAALLHLQQQQHPSWHPSSTLLPSFTSHTGTFSFGCQGNAWSGRRSLIFRGWSWWKYFYKMLF